MIREIILRGNSYERGYQHGQLLGTQIRALLKDNRARINSIRTVPLSDEQIFAMVSSYATSIESSLPAITQELHGLAAGAGISYQEAILLQLRMELISLDAGETVEGDCSSIAIHHKDNRISAQTIDLPGNMTEFGHIFRIIPNTTGGPEILMYGFAGLLGYMGMNSAGLSININMVLSGNWQPGVPPYLLVRHMLGMQSVAECLQALQQIKAGSSRSFLLSDQQQLVNTEFTCSKIVLKYGHCLLHANHFLHEDLIPEDKMHFLFRNSSVKRLALLQQLLPERTNGITPESLFTILSDHTLWPVGICAHAEGNIRRSSTVAAVVMQPDSFTMQVRKGYPCEAVTFNYSYQAVQHNRPANIKEKF